jgi:hypothetical protein
MRSNVESLVGQRQLERIFEIKELVRSVYAFESRINFAFTKRNDGLPGGQEITTVAPELWKPTMVFRVWSYDTHYISFNEAAHSRVYKGQDPFSLRGDYQGSDFILNFLTNLRETAKDDHDADKHCSVYFKEIVGKGMILTDYHPISNTYKKYYIQNLKVFMKIVGCNPEKTSVDNINHNEFSTDKVLSLVKRNDRIDFTDIEIKTAMETLGASPSQTSQVVKLTAYR